MKERRFFYFLLGLLVLSIAFAVVFQSMDRRAIAADKPVASGLSEELQNEFAAVVEKVNPSVVSIYVTKTVQTPELQPFWDFDMQIPPELREYFGFPQPELRSPRQRQRSPQQMPKQRGAGSGVIIDGENGCILTNNHVVEGAEDMTIVLQNDRTKYKATLVGADPRTDLAVVQIDAKDLKQIEWGDSDNLKVGHIVLAFGQPEGFRGTVTQGIVSAKGRANLGIIGAPGGISGYEDFIQTDAAINPGNSGGALVDIHGQLVGLNTAIATNGTPQFMGIGFAIPSNMARMIAEQLIERGEVTRGWLGVSIGDFGDIDDDIFKQRTGHEKKEYGEAKAGAFVDGVEPGQPAEKAGIKAGDLITKYDGKEVPNSTELRRLVAETAVDRKVKIELVRIVDGKPRTETLEVTIGKQPKDLAAATAGAGITTTDIGLSVQTITEEMAGAFGVEAGVVVTDVKAESRAGKSDIKRGDVITEVRYKGDAHEIKSADDFTAALSSVPSGESFVVTRIRSGVAKFVTIE